jgi:hypothetical protein
LGSVLRRSIPPQRRCFKLTMLLSPGALSAPRASSQRISRRS